MGRIRVSTTELNVAARVTATALPIILSLLLLGCAEVGQPSALTCVSNDDCPNGLCVEGRCASGEAEQPNDSEEPEGPDDIEVDPLEPGDDEDEGLAGFGEPCLTDAECESRYCVDAEEGRVCSQTCSQDCPDGYACRLLTNSGADAVRICIPVPDTLCDVCRTHAECGPNSYCLGQQNGRFCAVECQQNTDCPTNYFCNPNTLPGAGPGGGALEVNLCEPATGVCNPLELGATGVTATTTPATSERLDLDGRIIAVPHRVSGERFTLSGGF